MPDRLRLPIRGLLKRSAHVRLWCQRKWLRADEEQRADIWKVEDRCGGIWFSLNQWISHEVL
jgi:hypothetical protein